MSQKLSDNKLHILAFDVPFPPNYGGVIDVFYKIKYLKERGVEVFLHCFEYGRGEAKILEALCEEVYYYKRKNNWKAYFSFTPYIVKSRRSKDLVNRLLEDDAPILVEGMHTMGAVFDSRLRNRKKIYRESNIEHHYYYHLFKSESNIFKKIFFLLESFKLRNFQRHIVKFDLSLMVSEKDKTYMKTLYPDLDIRYLPSFHNNTKISSLQGKGSYALYNGNLSVAENVDAVLYLLETVFSKIDYPFVVAGLNPSSKLKNKLSAYSHIRLVENPSDEEMTDLIIKAHIHVLYTNQATGLKLKLLNTLFMGRFCLVNDKMVSGTHLEKACIIAQSSEDFIQKINELKHECFSGSYLEQREALLLKYYDNYRNIDQLINCIRE